MTTILAAVLVLAQGGEVAEKAAILADDSYANYWNRRDAFRSLSTIGTLEAAQAVIRYLTDAELAIQEMAVTSLAGMRVGADEIETYLATEILCGGAQNTSEVARAHAAWVLRLRQARSKVPELIQACRDRFPAVRARATEALGYLSDPRDEVVREMLENLVRDREVAVRLEALDAIRRLDPEDAKERIDRAVEERDPIVRAVAIEALGACEPGEIAKLLDDNQDHSAFPVRMACARIVPSHPDAEAQLTAAEELLGDRAWQVRATAIQAVVRMWRKEGIGLLIDRLGEETGRLRLDILQALIPMAGRNLGTNPDAWKRWWDAAKEEYEMPERPREGAAGEVAAEGTVAGFFGIPLFSTRMSFLIDYSGSMTNPARQGAAQTKIELALAEFRQAVEHMDRAQSLNIWCMNTEAVGQGVRSWQRQLAPALARVRPSPVEFTQSAWEKLGSLRRGRGDYYDCLIEAIQDPEMDTVIFLADGVPTYGRYSDRGNFLEAFGKENRYRALALHTVLMGESGTDVRFMQDLAASTGGVFQRRTAEEEGDDGPDRDDDRGDR